MGVRARLSRLHPAQLCVVLVFAGAALGFIATNHRVDQTVYKIASAQLRDAELNADTLRNTPVPPSAEVRKASALSARAKAIFDTKRVIDSLARVGTPSARETAKVDRDILKSIEANPASYGADDSSGQNSYSEYVSEREALIAAKREASARLANARSFAHYSWKRAQISKAGIVLLTIGIIALVRVWGSARSSKTAVRTS